MSRRCVARKRLEWYASAWWWAGVAARRDAVCEVFERIPRELWTTRTRELWLAACARAFNARRFAETHADTARELARHMRAGHPDRRRSNKPGWCDRRGGPALA